MKMTQWPFLTCAHWCDLTWSRWGDGFSSLQDRTPVKKQIHVNSIYLVAVLGGGSLFKEEMTFKTVAHFISFNFFFKKTIVSTIWQVEMSRLIFKILNNLIGTQKRTKTCRACHFKNKYYFQIAFPPSALTCQIPAHSEFLHPGWSGRKGTHAHGGPSLWAWRTEGQEDRGQLPWSGEEHSRALIHPRF